MAVSTQASADDPDGDGYIPPIPGHRRDPSEATRRRATTRSSRQLRGHAHRAGRSDRVPGTAGQVPRPHLHGQHHDPRRSTTTSLYGGSTTCLAPADASAYWMPSCTRGTGRSCRSVRRSSTTRRASPTTPVCGPSQGAAVRRGRPMQSAQEFRGHKGFVEGWECGDSFFNVDIPASCPSRPDVQLNVRMQAPSCWDGKYLDTPDHKSHMAYPVVKPGTNDNMCPASHPVALPMIEFKMAFPVNGDMSDVRLASGRGYSFHYDFFNAWEERTSRRWSTTASWAASSATRAATTRTTRSAARC
ncbi:DUF1996 domain-containing protein [Streptomyces sp. SHP22-7]|nr:DUF1996 domain-containing protein [Streptomyces sp. SHP22-7]